MSPLIKPTDAVPLSHCYGSEVLPLISVLISWWTSFQGVCDSSLIPEHTSGALLDASFWGAEPAFP